MPVGRIAGRSTGVLMLGTDPSMRGGVASVVATLRDAGLFSQCQVTYVATHVDGSRGQKIGRFIRALGATVRLFLVSPPLIVHAHVSSNGSFWRKALLLWIARRFGALTIFHLHDGTFGEFAAHGFGGPVLRWCIRRTLEGSSAVVALAPKWRQWLTVFAPRARIRVIGNPVACPNDAELSALAGPATDQGGKRVLFLGKVCEEKGVFDLLAAFARFAAGHPGWTLAIGGLGETERLLDEAERLGIRARVECLGWIAGARKAQELARTDIFVLPSYAEGMPVSVLEAMAYRNAVIVTPVGGVPDMMQAGVHGLWFEPGDVDALARCLSRLAESAQMRASLGTAARAHVLDSFSAGHVVSLIRAMYDEVSD